MPVKADVVAIKDLSKVVDLAVKDAAKKLQISTVSSTIIRPGTLIGLILKEGVTLQAAQGFATQVAKSAGKGAEPSLVFTKGGILAGYWPVNQFTHFGV